MPYLIANFCSVVKPAQTRRNWKIEKKNPIVLSNGELISLMLNTMSSTETISQPIY